MHIPSTKEEFLQQMASCLLFSVFNAPSSVEEKVKKLLSNFGISNPKLPSVYDYHGQYIKYFEDIWDMHESYFNPHVPSGYDPEDRIYIMGCQITRRWPMEKWLNEVEDSSNWNSGWFSNLPYHERKYLMPVHNFEDYEKNTPDVQRFRISHIPADVHFQDCIPSLYELYIAHPYKPGVYLPASQYEHLLFRERIHELSKVMMALGATDIQTVQNDGYKSSHQNESSHKTTASGSYGNIFSAQGSYSSASNNSSDSEKEAAILINFKNDPIKLPYIPSGLTWFEHESEWQQIADARINGNILEYEIRLSSKQVNLVSNNERSNIEAQARILLASGSFSRETTSASIFKEERAKSTSILIKFKSRKDY